VVGARQDIRESEARSLTAVRASDCGLLYPHTAVRTGGPRGRISEVDPPPARVLRGPASS
jgi:hypothetical protein